ncbi:PLC-like phosphodiesterases superfamily protein [Striga asiatica]|uniref:glycerophosphodiester phosphodiesterase n=1 Tax=Striga asiatica TaxID=4170 RepID=A0A5A7P494_STRAF|nr:PLC-like phosphodiesterases superfamily protein [Striga asiatica]
MATVISRWDRQRRQIRLHPRGSLFPRRKLLRYILITLAVIAILPPLYFHFSLRRFNQFARSCLILERFHALVALAFIWTCSFLEKLAFPEVTIAKVQLDAKSSFSMDAYNIALSSQVDCIEIDVSRSSDGVLFALHDRIFYNVLLTSRVGRDLQRISGNSTSKVGHLSMKEIVDLGSSHHHLLEHGVNVPTIEDALKLVSGSVRQVILDAKVGPPLYEKGLAKDILSIVGYIVMIDGTTGSRMKLLRMRGADVVGVYHPLIDEQIVKVLHRRKKKVYAWTVDEDEAMQKMLLEGVDAVVTSNPSQLQRVMQDVRTECFREGFSLNS